MKYILITGADGGLGSAIVKALLNKGEFVIGLDIKEPVILNNYLGIKVDITNEDSINNALEEVKKVTDHLDAIINTAGIVLVGSLIEKDPSYMEKIMNINFLGMVRVNYAFFPLLEKGRGRIINFSSEYGKYISMPLNGYYTISKHAVEAYSDSLRRELKYIGLKVITIRPGAFITDMQKGTYQMFDELLEETNHYKKEVSNLYPMLKNGNKGAKDPSVLAKVVLKAIYKKRPKRIYKKNHDIKVKLLSILPSHTVDNIFYRLFK